uniref:G2 and S-phase expressed 1 n=1 Tax=Pelodiscus sinensis TaxID=13735 RepID=K7G2J3_PELSI
MGSSEDLLSDKSSVASDVCDSSFSGSASLQDKQTLPSQTKVQFRLRMTQLKPPSTANGPLRKNTSSSSSSSISSMNSSLNSSLSISPIGGNGTAKSSVSSKISVINSKLSSTQRLAMVRPIRISSAQAVHSDVSYKQTRLVSTPKISTAGNLAKPSASMTGSQNQASGIQRLSSVPNLQKIPQQNKDGSAAKGNTCPKGKTKVILTPTNQVKVPKRCGGIGSSSENIASKVVEPIRLLSCGTFGRYSGVAVCTPVRPSEDGASQNSCLSSRSILTTPASIKRSALPTPASRRISGIPAMTPKTVPRSVSSPHFKSVHQVSSMSSKKTFAAGYSFKQARDLKTEVSSFEDDLSPLPVIPLTLDFSPEKTTEIAENAIQETEVQKQPAEGAQANEV